MKLLTLKYLIIFIYLISSSIAYSIEHPNIKNLVFYKESKKIEDIEFESSDNVIINLDDFRNKLVILNFWATWCAPCRQEMPSLNKLQKSKKFNNLQIFPINVGQENLSKSINFFERYEITNLKVYTDSKNYLPNKFSLRGIPTTIIINKEGEEFARIVGTIDFADKDLIKWLKKFD